VRYEAISLGDVILQIFSVVVGILLALFIDSWRTERQQQATVDTAMDAIRAELSANRIALRAHATRMFDMAKRTQESAKNANQPPRRCYEWDQWRGIGGLNLVDAAYQAAIATQALAHMPFAQASQVAQTYGWQRYFQKGFDLNGTLLMGNSQSLDFCVGIIEVIGHDDLQLDAEYARLIGADSASLPAPPRSH
jgi:type II secretory pathway pseudopilin PulG